MRTADWSLLERYRPAAEEKKALEQERERLEKLARELAGAGVCEAEGMRKLCGALDGRCAELKALCTQVEKELESVDDPVLRGLLQGHFVEGLEWEKLAEREGKSVKWVYWKVGETRRSGKAKEPGTL